MECYARVVSYTGSSIHDLDTSRESARLHVCVPDSDTVKEPFDARFIHKTRAYNTGLRSGCSESADMKGHSLVTFSASCDKGDALL